MSCRILTTCACTTDTCAETRLRNDIDHWKAGGEASMELQEEIAKLEAIPAEEDSNVGKGNMVIGQSSHGATAKTEGDPPTIDRKVKRMKTDIPEPETTTDRESEYGRIAEQVFTALPAKVKAGLQTWIDGGILTMEEKTICEWCEERDPGSGKASITRAAITRNLIVRAGFQPGYAHTKAEQLIEAWKERAKLQRKVWLPHKPWQSFQSPI